MDWKLILTIVLLISLYQPKTQEEYTPIQYEQRDYYVEPVKIRTTCYKWTGNKTASGCYPYEGICASNREHLGDVAVLYTMDMKYIGCFECRDIGGAESLRNGTSIDIYRDTLDRCYEWVHTYGDYTFIQWIEADG